MRKSLPALLLSTMLVGANVAIVPQVLAKTTTSVKSETPGVAPQYDTTHVYVNPEDFDKFTDSLVATFGGTKSKQGVFQVTPTPSQTISQLVLTPVGTLSVFGFKTPVPHPFGLERTGYLVKDMDAAVQSAKANGADVIVETFPDPIGRDAVIQWPGGVNMQLYWHTNKPSYNKLETVPENRIYISKQSADSFVKKFVNFSHGKVVSDTPKAAGVEIGRPNETYRRIRVESDFGKMTVLVTDGHLPYPYGHDMTGYEVKNISETLDKATKSGATVLVNAYKTDGREAAMVQFPGGYIAEIHAATK
ncbi:VOC family protein [Acinetobacter pittii]|uniref:VOC family protein n=1 Tax=Acinetobacter pittii TaxID=48296 RepID=UPI001F054001|nr:VOC family protein [Acinetobacter pittii]MCH2052522.1 VOC family protein [Acinetobacter pittii]